MRILISGGSGYIGSVLCRMALDFGHEVIDLDAGWFGHAGVVDLQDNERFILWEHDIRYVDADMLRSLHIDAIIHGAGFSNDPTAEADPQLNNDVNHLGTRALAEAAKLANVKVFTFMSSASIYDTGSAVYHDRAFDEDEAVWPIGAYARSKYMAEQALKELASESFRVVIFRQGTVSGPSPRMRFDLVVNAMVRTGYRTGMIDIHLPGTQYRPLVRVHDVALAHLLAVASPPPLIVGQGWRLFNLAAQNARIDALALAVGRRMTMLGTSVLTRRVEGPIRTRDYKIRYEHLSQTRPWTTFFAFDPVQDVDAILTMLHQYQDEGRDLLDPSFENLSALRTRAVPLL